MNSYKLTSGKHDYFIPSIQRSTLSIEVSRQKRKEQEYQKSLKKTRKLDV